MNEIGMRRRATVHDVARVAGVSLATVDRVLNGRPGVRPQTVEKVEAAIGSLGFSRDLSASLLARARDLRLLFIIPDGGNEFMARLAQAVADATGPALPERTHLQTLRVPALDASALAAALDRLDPRDCDCAVVVASDESEVMAAAERAEARGLALMTLVSDLPGAQHRPFVGIDNVAAGRTAASLLGRFVQRGKIGVVAGSLHLRDHADRLLGFRSVLASEFPEVEIVGPVEGHDEEAATQVAVLQLLAEHPDLLGLYNLGAGNSGLVPALEQRDPVGHLRVVAHELTGSTRAGLLSGTVDVVLDQNPDGEIRTAIGAARALVLGGGGTPPIDPIEIGIFLRDNLR